LISELLLPERLLRLALAAPDHALPKNYSQGRRD
jgi:hypothetical protein